MRFEIPKLYPITDTGISGMSHAAQIEQLAAGGATFIQLREKRSSPREFYLAGLEAMSVARKLGVQIIVNDRVDIAMAIKADGVHLGQTDIPPERARLLLGESRIVGYSTHTLEQALAADLTPVDYLAIGPVFETSTKENPDSTVGLGMLSLIRSRINKPLVAIGGIALTNAPSVIEAGADSVAVISDLLTGNNIAERTKAYLDRLG